MVCPGTAVFLDCDVYTAKQYLYDLTPLALNSITHHVISEHAMCAETTSARNIGGVATSE